MTKTSYPKTVLVLGASGLVGAAVFAALNGRGVRVTGTARKETDTLLTFDTARPGGIESFPWGKYEIIVDCTGTIQYDATLSAHEANITGNVRTPLAIIKQLGPTQRYFYCSTHAVFASENERTTYAASKYLFEESVRDAEDISAKVTIVRLPAVFSERRGGGLMYQIKEHFLHKEKFKLAVKMNVWHTMYLPRVAEVFSQLVLSAPEEKRITIGYPTETSFEKIIAVAEKTFGYAIPIQIISCATDHYIPTLEVQQKYASLEAGDFEEDLRTYFKK